MLVQDGSLAITYGFADIQHNTFESFIGKPFKDFKPILKGVSKNNSHNMLAKRICSKVAVLCSVKYKRTKLHELIFLGV